jgi:adenylate kinase
MPRWERAVVVGVPGVGKSSLCRAASHNLGYKYVNYGELMLEIALKDGSASTLPEMFQLDLEVQHYIWERAALSIKDEREVLLDLHGVDHFREGYLISLPFEILPPDIIIIIEAPYTDILRRRTYDSSKKRLMENFQTIKEHMGILRLSMSSISARLGCGVAIIKNHDFGSCLDDLQLILGE